MNNPDTLWLAIGFAGQLLFTSRFLVQWIASERSGRSVVPLAFWWFSLAGGVTLLAYALWRQDPVFAIGHRCEPHRGQATFRPFRTRTRPLCRALLE